jgi:hypothetical protein
MTVSFQDELLDDLEQLTNQKRSLKDLRNAFDEAERKKLRNERSKFHSKRRSSVARGPWMPPSGSIKLTEISLDVTIPISDCPSHSKHIWKKTLRRSKSFFTEETFLNENQYHEENSHHGIDRPSSPSWWFPPSPIPFFSKPSFDQLKGSEFNDKELKQILLPSRAKNKNQVYMYPTSKSFWHKPKIF